MMACGALVLLLVTLVSGLLSVLGNLQQLGGARQAPKSPWTTIRQLVRGAR